jgi:hypothetical protein
MMAAAKSVSHNELVQALAPARLAPYRSRCTTDQEAVCLYLHNLHLSRELYPVLNSVEVALRNRIHTAATAHFGSPDWFRDARLLRLEWRQRNKVEEVQDNFWRELHLPVRQIRQGSLPLPPPANADDHVAALTFGFWTALLSGPYERRLWDGARVTTSPNLIPAVFPHAPRADRVRATIFPLVDRLRKLRNRVSHNEPILWWSPGLQAEYRTARQVLGWISPTLSQLMQCVDGFDVAYTAGHMPYLTKVIVTT